MLATVGQCGPNLGTRIFPTSQSPYYSEGMWICCAFSFIVFALATSLSLLLRMENKRSDGIYGK